jgi:hypothetical protein
MDLIPEGNSPIRSKSHWPNMIVFPKELRDAIPEYGSRALVFDSVSESHPSAPVPVSGMTDTAMFDMGARAQIQLLVHETGNLKGKFTLIADLDTETTRALGRFLIDLADRADTRHS